MLPILLVSTALAGGPADLQAVLDQHVSAGRVDYAAIHASDALAGTTAWLAGATEPTAKAERMAFWINAYNALTIQIMASEWPVASIRDLDGGKVWDARTLTVAGKKVTLNDIEHRILRPMGDARVHAAVNCASRGCPPIASKLFTGADLEAQLSQASQAWMRANGVKVDRSAGAVSFNRIFDWYGEDFIAEDDCGIPLPDKKHAAAACFASKHVPEADAAFLRAGGYAAANHAYSWEVNAR